jgi:hypothetical protein
VLLQQVGSADSCARTKQAPRASTGGADARNSRAWNRTTTRAAARRPTTAGAAAAASVAAASQSDDPEAIIKKGATKRRKKAAKAAAAAGDAEEDAEEERNESEDEELPPTSYLHTEQKCSFCGIPGQGKRGSKRQSNKGLRFVLRARSPPDPARPKLPGGTGAPSEKYFPKVFPNGKRSLLPLHPNPAIAAGHWACCGISSRCGEKNLALILAERQRVPAPPAATYDVGSPAVSALTFLLRF